MIRKSLFWVHLALGLAAAIPISVMAVTGILLSFEPQIVSWVESDFRSSPPPVDRPAVGLDSMVASARRMVAGKPTAVQVARDPAEAVQVSFGRETVVWVDAATGAVVGRTTAIHSAFALVERIHRWLGSREIGGVVTGVSVLLLLVLAASGTVLWWPRNLKAARQVIRPRAGLTGRARDWQWHNSIGLLSMPLLLVLSLTGTVMAWKWAEAALYASVGSEAPRRDGPPKAGPGGEAMRKDGAGRESGERKHRGPEGTARGESGDRREGHRTEDDGKGLQARAAVRWQALADTAIAHAPSDWGLINIRPSDKPTGGAQVMVRAKDGDRTRGGTVALASDGTFEKFTPFRSDLGSRLRFLVKPLHTGELLGFAGQLAMALASLGCLVLVWTGLALSWNRWRRSRRRALEA